MSAQMNTNDLAAVSSEIIKVKSGQIIGYRIGGAFICADDYKAPEPPKEKITFESRKRMISAIDESAMLNTRDSGYDRPSQITCRASRGQCRLFG